jgi:hypothetical protein
MRGYLESIDTGGLGRAAGSVPISFSGELQGTSPFPLLGRSISFGEALLSVLEICLQKSKDTSGSDSTLMQPSKSPFTPCKGLFAKQWLVWQISDNQSQELEYLGMLSSALPFRHLQRFDASVLGSESSNIHLA